MSRLASLFLLALLTTVALAQTAEPETELRAAGTGCVGGDGCRNRQFRVPLEDKPVISVSFRAHDNVGEKAEGALRVKIDGNTIRGYIDIPRRGEVFTLDVDELLGRSLIFEAANDDEVEISNVNVIYAARGRGRTGGGPRDRDGRSADGWREYPRAAGCIGGNECGKNGKRITIPLDERPVLGVRFYAHDSIGERADGKLSVRIDETKLAYSIDVQRAGKLHEIEADSIVGSKLVIETVSNDEVDIKDIEVLYGRRRRNRGGPSEISHQGGCIGGEECGGRYAEIRIDLDGRPVESLRLYARDDVGTRAKGVLKIRIDDETLEYWLDIPREGRTFTIDGKNIAGDYLYIEPADDDEVVIRDIRIKFRPDEYDDD